MEIRPDHYLSSDARAWECWDLIDRLLVVCKNPRDGFYIGIVIKYLYRYMMKDDPEDIRKAVTYLNRIIYDNKPREEE